MLRRQVAPVIARVGDHFGMRSPVDEMNAGDASQRPGREGQGRRRRHEAVAKFLERGTAAAKTAEVAVENTACRDVLRQLAISDKLHLS